MKRNNYRKLMLDMMAYLDRVMDWYEGGRLPGELAAKDLWMRIHKEFEEEEEIHDES